MQSQHDHLNQVLEALKANVQLLSANVRSLRNDIASNGIREHNAYYANQILKDNRYMDESEAKLEQWGILDAADDKAVEKIIYEVIEYRRDASLHHCE